MNNLYTYMASAIQARKSLIEDKKTIINCHSDIKSVKSNNRYSGEILQKIIELFDEFPGNTETKLKYLELSLITIRKVRRNYKTTWFKVVEREILNWLDRASEESAEDRLRKVIGKLSQTDFDFLIPYIRWEFQNDVEREEKFWDKFRNGEYDIVNKQ